MALNHEELFGAKNASPCVRGVFGISGSGKTVFLNEMLKQASRSNSYGKMWRAVIFDVKHDGYEDLLPKKVNPATNMHEVIKSMKDSRITVIHPEIDDSQLFLDEVVDYLFNTARRVEGFSASLILEESSTYITSHHVPPSLKRLATQGRSLGLSFIVANQRTLSNKWLETQSTSNTLFRLARPDSEMLKKKWGLNPETLEEKLSQKKFSFAHHDLENLTLHFYEPIDITRLSSKAEIKPKKRQNPLSGSIGPNIDFLDI